MISIYLKGQEVSQICVDFSLEKTVLSPCACFYCGFAVQSFGGWFPKISIKCGDEIRVSKDGVVVFIGNIMRTGYLEAEGILKVWAYDKSYALCINDVLGVFVGSSGEIGKSVCQRLGVKVFALAEGGENYTKIARSGSNALSLIKSVYGDEYYIEYNDGLIIQKIGDVSLDFRGIEILGARGESSCEDIVSRVVLLDGKDRVVDEARLGARGEGYPEGVRYVRYNSSLPERQLYMRDRLMGLREKGELTVMGNFDIKCGRKISLDLPYQGFEGQYNIRDVRHYFDKGLYLTQVGIERQGK